MDIKINKEQLEALLWAAPETLELVIGSKLTSNTFQEDSTRDWSQCRLKEFTVDVYCDQNTMDILLLQYLGKMSSIESFSLTLDTDRVWDATEYSLHVTRLLTNVLEKNQKIHYLWVDGFLPEVNTFCQQLRSCKCLKTLCLLSLHDKELYYFEQLLDVLSSKDLCIERLDYSCDESPVWGPCNIEYPLTLNRCGLRQKMMEPTITGSVLVEILAQFCGQSTKEKLLKDGKSNLAIIRRMKNSGKACEPDAYSDTESVDASEVKLLETIETIEAVGTPPWARTHEIEDLKNTGTLYGLLRESPATWAGLAMIENVCSVQGQHAKPKARKLSKKRRISRKKRKHSNAGTKEN